MNPMVNPGTVHGPNEFDPSLDTTTATSKGRSSAESQLATMVCCDHTTCARNNGVTRYTFEQQLPSTSISFQQLPT